MWVVDYSPELGIYAARCEFLKPGWLDMRQRIIDIGFLGEFLFYVYLRQCCGPSLSGSDFRVHLDVDTDADPTPNFTYAGKSAIFPTFFTAAPVCSLKGIDQ